MAEAKLYKKLKKIMSENNIPIMLQRIESGGTGTGIPDVAFRTEKMDGWLEAKEVKWPKRNETNIRIVFQPGQYAWIHLYRKLGGNIFLMVLCEEKIHLFNKSNIRDEYTQLEFLTKSCYRKSMKHVDPYVFIELLDKENYRDAYPDTEHTGNGNV